MTDQDSSSYCGVSRRTVLQKGAVAGAALLAGSWSPASGAASARPAPHADAPWIGASIPQLQTMLNAGVFTSRELVQGYLARIDALNPLLGAVIQTNPQAVSIATQLDNERRAGRMRGPLHGIPLLLKDNIATNDTQQTTAGSLALVNTRVPADAQLVAQLRRAGAIILGKANLSEWANFRGFDSISGWSARGGFTVCPYVLDDNPWGSSSGSAVAVAADLCAAAVGTETDGSIMAPSHASSTFGVKPTLGRISGKGVIPLARSQDTAGPMTRSAIDSALLLSAMSEPAYPFAVNLQRGALNGVRLGFDPLYFDDWYFGSPQFKPVVDNALAVLQSLGAVLVPVQTDPSWLLNGDEFTVLLYEFKVQIAEYLATLKHSQARTLADLIRFNETHCWQEMRYFGQSIFEYAEGTSGNLLDPEYLNARARCLLNSRVLGIDKVLQDYNVQALIAPTWTFLYSFAAVAGYPSLSLPIGYMPNEVVGAPWNPDEVVTRRGSPVGFCFIGGAWQEARILRFAYDLEQQLQAQRLPQYLGQVPQRFDAKYCTGKPKPHGGTGNLNWREGRRRRML
jgi:amidase